MGSAQFHADQEGAQRIVDRREHFLGLRMKDGEYVYYCAQCKEFCVPVDEEPNNPTRRPRPHTRLGRGA